MRCTHFNVASIKHLCKKIISRRELHEQQKYLSARYKIVTIILFQLSTATTTTDNLTADTIQFHLNSTILNIIYLAVTNMKHGQASVTVSSMSVL